MKPWGTILYFTICAAISVGFICLGITAGFTNTLDISFVALLWLFVVFAMKTRLTRVTPGTPLPLSNLRVNTKASKVLRGVFMGGSRNGLDWRLLLVCSPLG
jgi:hypothetical protein